MNKIEKTFTYTIPDDYLYQTTELNKTAEWTYNGPDRIWVFIDKETHILYPGLILTDDNNGETYPTPLDKYKVMVDCDKDTLLCTVLGFSDLIDYTKLPQYIEELPNGKTYQRPDPPTPDHTYSNQTIKYDPVSKEFVQPFDFIKPTVSWEDIRRGRDIALEQSDHRVLPDLPETLKKKWEDYRQALRDLPQDYGASDKSQIPMIDPWKVQEFPRSPIE